MCPCAGRSRRDELNNNEQVHIHSPEPGNWTVSVQAKLLSESPAQNYSLVITADGFMVRLAFSRLHLSSISPPFDLRRPTLSLSLSLPPYLTHWLLAGRSGRRGGVGSIAPEQVSP